MSLTAVFDHTALVALYQADPFLTGLYIESSRGTGRILVPALSVLAAERLVAGAGAHAARLRFAEAVPFTVEHALDSTSWPATGWQVTHPAAIAWQAAKSGEPVTVLSLTPEAYEGTGVYPLNPS
ncbi:PIN domain-containing protein [Streptomyces sp. NPDC056254]|uniref:PIN domain-containing protein n=1 Tax=Streptomyces sp. NPDC056254 TaxID=3345763 RepID=UPI0035E12F94